MPEYDPNLPQEFARMRKRPGTAGVAIAVAVATALVTLALYVLTQSMPPMGHNTMADHQETAPSTAPQVPKNSVH
jgi:hypothetical protein